jgi:cytochrome c553
MRIFSAVKNIKYLFLTIFLLLFHLTVHSTMPQEGDSVLFENRVLGGEELIRGERLFFGLVYQKNKSINCAGCHNTRVSDTLNWNPDALEISKKYLDKSATDLSKILLKPVGKKMVQVHSDIQLTPEDIVMIKGYMDKLADFGLTQDKPVITNILLFIIALILFLFSITDLIISKKIKKRWINYLILLLTGLFITHTLVIEAMALGRSEGYAPDQPVKFSHAVHSGQNGTDCLYCHSYAPESKTSGFPPENVCMNCHLLIRNGTRSGAIEIAKVISAYDSLKPIEWIKVYNLQDHVFFSHAQHISVGGVTCQECHGKVEEMDIIKQIPDLSMGWCISCHRSRSLDIEKNMFYSEYKDLADKIIEEKIDSVTVDMMGGIECMKCHY